MSDIHFGARNDSDFFLQSFLTFSKQIFFPYLVDNDISTVLLLGDIWDRRKYVNFNTLHKARTEFFDKLCELNIATKMIYGNHDIFFKNTTEVNSIDLLLDSYPNIEIVDFAKEFDFDGLRLGMISWIHNGNLTESLDWINTSTADILCGHFEINDFEITDGIKAKHGFDSSIFKRFEYVFSGHFHTMSNNGQIFYLGNPHQLTWSDYGLKKGFHIFDTDTRQISLIENPYKIYEKHYYKDDVDLLTFDFNEFNNKIVRIYVDTLELKSRQKFDLFVDKMSQVGYDIIVQEMDHSLSTLSNDSEQEMTSADALDYIKQYVDNIDDSIQLNKHMLKTYFNEIYNMAIEKSHNL